MIKIGDWVRFKKIEEVSNHLEKSDFKVGQVVGQRILKKQPMNIVHLKAEGNVEVPQNNCQLVKQGDLYLK